MALHPVAQARILTDDDIDFVNILACEAGKVAASMREGVCVQEKSGPHDPVTDADFELSRMITSALRRRFPGDPIVSEEDDDHTLYGARERVWFIDPIDGTNNYIRNDGQYTVMIGLLVKASPAFGWVYAPASATSYFGGPGYGTWKKLSSGEQSRYQALEAFDPHKSIRLIMGHRDRKSHPWIENFARLRLIKSGSIGLKVARILDDEADMYVHLSGKLKLWDTAGPAAIALAAGLEVGSMDSDRLAFDVNSVYHNSTVIIGRPGALTWCRENLRDFHR